MPLFESIVEGIGMHLGSKVVDHVHKKIMGTKRRKNSGYTLLGSYSSRNKANEEKSYFKSLGYYNFKVIQDKTARKTKLFGVKKVVKGEFIGVRVNGSKIQLKLPNKNPSTLKSAAMVASKLGYKINPHKEEFYQIGVSKHGSIISVGKVDSNWFVFLNNKLIPSKFSSRGYATKEAKRTLKRLNKI